MKRRMVKILVVDDDPAILDSTKLLLTYEGYQVQTASDGDVVRNLSQNLPDIILLDIWLSGTNGGEIANHLKHQPETRNIPIILFSANRDIAKIAKQSGAEDYLVKPFDLAELRQKIAKYTEG